MGIILDGIVASARRVRGYADRLMSGIDAGIAATRPSPGGVEIDCNHPSFVLGHLGLYPVRLAGAFGVVDGDLAPPAEWNDLFKAGAPCLHDPLGRTYPPFGRLLDHYVTSHDRLLDRLAGVDDGKLALETSEERLRQYFPTMSGLASFMLCAHRGGGVQSSDAIV